MITIARLKSEVADLSVAEVRVSRLAAIGDWIVVATMRCGNPVQVVPDAESSSWPCLGAAADALEQAGVTNFTVSL